MQSPTGSGLNVRGAYVPPEVSNAQAAASLNDISALMNAGSIPDSDPSQEVNMEGEGPEKQKESEEKEKSMDNNEQVKETKTSLSPDERLPPVKMGCWNEELAAKYFKMDAFPFGRIPEIPPPG